MINLSEVVNDPDFAQDYVVQRSTGAFGMGKFIITNTIDVPFYGIIQPASDEDIAQVEEGDRVTGMMSFISSEQMYKTRGQPIGGTGEQGIGDKITWNGEVYKVVVTTPWVDFGFWKAIASRQSGL